MNDINIHHSFSVDGMTCASCARIVERSLKKTQGVEYVSVNLATEKAYVVSSPDVGEELIQKAVESSGYRYLREHPDEDKLEERYAKAKKRATHALLVTIPLMVLMLIHMSGRSIPGFTYLEIIAGLYLMLGPGRESFRGAAIALAHKHANMDSLVSIGTATAWLTAPLSLSPLQLVSFGTISTMVISFHLLGRFIEARLKRKASVDIRAIMEGGAKAARVESESGILEVPVESVKVGALVQIRSGEKVPLDGEIIEGSGAADESMISGEPVPVEKKIGEELTGGTILSSGYVRMKVSKTGEDSFLSRMIKLVEDAQASTVPLQALADRISLYFVPTVIIIALLSAVTWFFAYESFVPFLEKASQYIFWVRPDMGASASAIFVFVAVLVIACPCALGLATPMALVAGSGAAAARGILLKNGEAVSTSGKISRLLLDKTGTLTEGFPAVSEAEISDEELRAAAAVEAASVHPLAKAVCSYAEERLGKIDLKAEDPQELAGSGISGSIKGVLYRIGKPKDPSRYRAQTERGASVIEIERDGEYAGWIALRDPLKQGAKAFIARLKEKEIAPVMLTGDNKQTAEAVAAEIGIEEVRADVLPDQKAAVVREYQQSGAYTAMVGDGINDAAALRTADIGIAMGNGTDLSIESADIVLISESIGRIADALEIGAKTSRTIKQNLFWAFIYNLAALPAAAAALLHPAVAEIAMTFSSINVIANSLRIRRMK